MQPQHPMQGHQMQPMIPAFATTNITTEHIQKYLDENKQLILAILDNQNLGKLNECAHYQAKLQQNLMYLAAIADSQPQSPAAHSQIPPNAAMQPGAHYMQQHQAQQQVAQSVMAGRVPMQYAQLQQEHQHQQQLQQQQQQQQQQLHHQHQHQQSIHSQLGMSSGGNNGLQMLHSEAGMGGNGPLSRGLPDFGRGTAGSSGEAMQTNRGLGADARVGNKQDGVASANAHPGSGDGHGSSTGGHNADESEPSYLKASEEEGN
uniref:SS18 N-terminal domain-containing protein n=1 Tax=Araucaria cunninghamii TaxID=56994 RepID=A0A0D6QWV8_ARACU